MELSVELQRHAVKKLLIARTRLLCDNGFYGLLLMHMGFALDENCTTAATDGEKIYFNPEFLAGLDDVELDYVLQHQVLHAALNHITRREDRDEDRFHTACDIVVNATILRSKYGSQKSITLREYGGPQPHTVPDGRIADIFSVEEVYALLPLSNKPANGDKKKQARSAGSGGNAKKQGEPWDDHSKWESKESQEALGDTWTKHTLDAVEAMYARDPNNERGLVPAFAQRMLNEIRKPQTDWHSILQNFVQEEIVDYSFLPPDRRYDGDFFLPDYNEKEERPEDILFMIDTSGSMSEEMITTAYSEVKGAVDQFGGKLKGWLGFFDAEVIAPKPFEDEEDLSVIRPQGGGGTDFDVIFDYVRDQMRDKQPASIIILTDGYAPFPDPSAANDIPVLWLINNDKVTPPWGRVARIQI